MTGCEKGEKQAMMESTQSGHEAGCSGVGAGHMYETVKKAALPPWKEKLLPFSTK